MTTLNLTVTASGNDWHSTEGYGSFSSSDEGLESGADTDGARHAGLRFTGVSGLSGATINSADLNIPTRSTELGTALVRVYCADAAAQAAPTTAGQHQAITRTTAFTTFESYGHTSDGSYMTNPIDITGGVQELADDYDPSVIMPLLDDNGSSTSGNNYMRLRSTDRVGASDPKLDIDYTAAGARRVFVVS